MLQGAAGFWRPFCLAARGSATLCCIAKENMLLCKQTDCCWHLVYVNCPQIMMQRSAELQKGMTMSKTASIGFTPSSNLFSRLMATIDRLLMTSARAAVRNGDLP